MTPAEVHRLAAGNQARSGTFAVLAWYDLRGWLWLAPLGAPAPDRGEPMPAAWICVDTVRSGSDR